MIALDSFAIALPNRLAKYYICKNIVKLFVIYWPVKTNSIQQDRTLQGEGDLHKRERSVNVAVYKQTQIRFIAHL